MHYSTERKHVFIDVSYPPAAAQFDFRVESSQVAQEITAALADAAGAARASGLREIAEASGDPIPPLPSDSALAKHHRRVQSPDEEKEEDEDFDDEGQDDDDRVMAIAVYDFDAQGEDELSLTQDMRVEVVDDQKSDEWWKCRAADGREGVVPSSYVEKIRRRRGGDRPKRKKQQQQQKQHHQETALSRTLAHESSGVGKRDRARAKSESSTGQSSRKPEGKAESK